MRIALGHVVRLMPEHPLERAAAKIHILPLQIQDLALPHAGEEGGLSAHAFESQNCFDRHSK